MLDYVLEGTGAVTADGFARAFPAAVAKHAPKASPGAAPVLRYGGEVPLQREREAGIRDLDIAQRVIASIENALEAAGV